MEGEGLGGRGENYKELLRKSVFSPTALSHMSAPPHFQSSSAVPGIWVSAIAQYDHMHEISVANLGKRGTGHILYSTDKDSCTERRNKQLYKVSGACYSLVNRTREHSLGKLHVQ